MLELNKNLLINGNRYYSQRKPSGQVTPTTGYQYLTNDRYVQKITGTITTPTVEAASDFPISKSPWCSKYTGITANGSSVSEMQCIEADFGLHLIGDYVSFLTYLTSTSYSTLTVNIGYATAKDNFVGRTLLVTKDFTLKTDGTVNEIVWAKINQLSSLISTGLYVEMILSNPTNTSTSSTHRFGGATLVRGRYAPSETLFAARNLISEMSLCQRYYRKSYEYNEAIGSNCQGRVALRGGYSADMAFAHVVWDMAMRTLPTLTAYHSATGAVNQVRTLGSGTGASVTAFASPCSKGFEGVISSAAFSVNTMYEMAYTAVAEL